MEDGMAIGHGSPNGSLTESEIRGIVSGGFPSNTFDGKRVLVLTPDATRTCPLPFMARTVVSEIGARTRQLDFMIALGSHQPLSEERINALFGIAPGDRERDFKGARFFNHRWDVPGELQSIGTIGAAEIKAITGGLFEESVDVVINRAVFEYDALLILGPVFPHEVVGFSGGNKYLFPGISGGDFLHFSHWLGAVITCPKTIGYKHNPVRTFIDKAAVLVPVPCYCIAMVVNHSGGLAGLYVGETKEAWSAAADLSAQIHVVYVPKSFHTVIGAAPAIYDELWTAGKVMYKLEPVVADGGSLTIYAPHLRHISRTWENHLERIGYHVRDWFLQRLELFADVPRGVLAHSTHVRGVGRFEDGIEKPRIEVVLATGLPEETCRRICLGYRDPHSIRLEELRGREAEGILVVQPAGEVLYRLASDRPEVEA
jgi:nickel-dependent lactate racemase